MSLNTLKLDLLLHNNTSAGKLFQVTGAAYENERLANSVIIFYSRDSQQWTCCRTCLAGGGVSDKMFFQLGWNTGRENLSRHHRRLVQDALTHWQPVEPVKQRFGITATTCCQNHTSCVVLRSGLSWTPVSI